jgi:hypothetical protein
MALNLKSTARGAALGFGIAALTFSGASGQVLQTAGTAPQAVAATPVVGASDLQKHCDNIKGVFILARDAVGFTKPYEEQLRTFFKSKCTIPFPIPVQKKDVDNVKTASYALSKGGGIELRLNLD